MFTMRLVNSLLFLFLLPLTIAGGWQASWKKNKITSMTRFAAVEIPAAAHAI